MSAKFEIKFSTNVKEYMRALKKAGLAIQFSASRAVNLGAKLIERRYISSMKAQLKLKASNNYTVNAVKINESKPVRKSGELRPLQNINAQIFVKPQKGHEHYLARMEKGEPRAKNAKTANKAPIPLTASRQGGAANKPIAQKYRLIQKELPNIGEPKNYKNARQYYVAIWQMVKRGYRGAKFGKMFLSTGRFSGVWTAKNRAVGAKGLTKLRATVSSPRGKKIDLFKQATESLKQADMERAFIVAARAELSKIRKP